MKPLIIYILIIFTILFTADNEFSETRIKVENIADIEKFGDSVVIMSNNENVDNPSYKNIFLYDLITNKIKVLCSHEFDGNYLRIIRISDSSFTCKISYDAEIGYCNTIHCLNGENLNYEKNIIQLVKKYDKKDNLFRNEFKETIDCNGCNVWKVLVIKNFSFLLLSNWKSNSKYQLISLNNENKKINVLFEAEENIPVCSDSNKIILINNQRLIKINYLDL